LVFFSAVQTEKFRINYPYHKQKRGKGMEHSEIDAQWEVFCKSGKIDDYLAYRAKSEVNDPAASNPCIGNSGKETK